MDSRIWILIAFFLVIMVTQWINGVFISSYVSRKEIKLSVALLGVLVIPVLYALGGWGDMIVWNMIAPQFSLPQIDLITAVGISFLLQSLIIGTTPRPVRIVKPDINPAK